MITASTKICALIGDPIGHSLSPLMHNAAFEHAGIDYAYLAFRVEGEQLAAAISGMRALGIKGLNVTIPHKVAVIPLLDSPSGPMAKAATLASGNSAISFKMVRLSPAF